MISFFRTSQFIIGLNKYLEAVNNKFSVGMRFKMRFEGDDAPERRYLVLILVFECCLISLGCVLSHTLSGQVHGHYCWGWRCIYGMVRLQMAVFEG